MRAVIRQAMKADPPPTLACKEGCDWCCHLTVGTSVPEVVRIVAYLRQTLSPRLRHCTGLGHCHGQDHARDVH